MIAFEVSHIVRAPVFFRGPAIFQDAVLTSWMNEEAICVFNPTYIGHDLYFHYAPISSYKWLLANYGNLTTPQLIPSGRMKRVLKKLLLLATRYMQLEIKVDRVTSPSDLPFELIPASEIKTLVSFFQSDEIWKMRLPDIKKCLFLFDLSFFDILRNHNVYNGGLAPRHITAHIENTNIAATQAQIIFCPTNYLKNEIPKYFNLSLETRVINIPLCSNQMIEETQRNDAKSKTEDHLEKKSATPELVFKKLRFPSIARPPKTLVIKKRKKKFKLILVSGFDGFQNDNKGLGNLLDLMRLQKLLFPDGNIFHLTLVSPPNEELSERIKSLNLQSDIDYQSFLSKEDLTKRMRQSDSLIVTSIDEGFCLPVQEAALLKVPVIATAVPSLRELWEDSIGYIDPWNRYLAARQLQQIPKGDVDKAYQIAINQTPENCKIKMLDAIHSTKK